MKTFPLSLTFGALLLSVMPVSKVFADILFIDTNFSETEVAAARKAAQARHEKLIVIPTDDISAEGRALIHKVQPLERDYHERIEATGYPKFSRPTDQKLLEDLATIKKEYGFSLGNVARKIATLPPNTVKDVIFSGHSEGSILQGMLYKGAQLEINSVKDLLVESKQFSLKGVYVWGCYSMTGGRAIEWDQWKKSFPQMNAVAMKAEDKTNSNSDIMGWGFDTRAPSNAGGVGSSILGKLLMQEPELEKMKDQKALLAQAQKIVGSSKAEAGAPKGQVVGLSGVVNGTFISTNQNTARCLTDLPNGCLNKITFLTQDRKNPKGFNSMAECMMSAEPSDCTEDLPPSNNDHSVLRRYYDQVQHSTECLGHCGAPLPAKVRATYAEAWQDDEQVPCPNDLIKLIKHDEIVHNALTYLKPQIDSTDAALKSNPDLQKKFEAVFKSGSTQPRVLLQRINDFVKAFSEHPPQGGEDPAKTVERFNRLINFPSCAPFSWIEEQEHPAPPEHC